METWCKLGDIYFNLVEEETINFQNEVTEKPVEDGSNVNDHIENKPIIINIKGAIFHRKVIPMWHIEQLRKIWKDKKIVTYIGMENWGNVVITSFRNTYNNTLRNGIEFEMSLQQVVITKKTYTNINTSNFTIPNIEKLKEQIQDKKDAKKEAKQDVKRAVKEKKKEAEKKKKAQAKLKVKTKKGRQTKQVKKTKKSLYSKIMSKY